MPSALSQTIRFWDPVLNTSDLPNVLGSSTQSTNLNAGDYCRVSSSNSIWKCDDPTPGSAVWTEFLTGVSRSNSTPLQVAATGGPGTDPQVSRADHEHALTFTAPATGAIAYFTGTVWERLAAAANGTFLSLVGGLPAWVVAAFAPLTRVLTAGNGLQGGGDLTADRTFEVKPANASITAAPGGTAVGFAGATPAQVGATASVGSGVTPSHEDHAHALTFTAPTDGALVWYDGANSRWERLAPGTARQKLQTNGAAAPTWVDAGDDLLFGASGVGANAATRYLYPGWSNSTATVTAPIVQWRVTRPGTLSAMYVQSAGAGSGAVTETINVRVNGVVSALTVGILGNATQANASATVAVVAGDRVDVELVKSGATDSGAIAVSVRFD